MPSQSCGYLRNPPRTSPRRDSSPDMRCSPIWKLAVFIYSNKRSVLVLFFAMWILSMSASMSPYIMTIANDDEDLINSLGVPMGIDLARNLDKIYGRKIVMEGLDQCAAFRRAVSPADRFVGIAGMYNTGTHAIFSYMDKYCSIPGKDQEKIKNKRNALGADAKNMESEVIDSGFLFETYWGKHKHVTDRGSVVTLPKYAGLPVENLLPIVMIKDPFTWLSSMCRNPYNWQEGRQYKKDGVRCPNLTGPDGISAISAKIKYSMMPNRLQRPDMQFDSLIHMYNQWYQEWEEVTFPRLIVRFEDLLLHPKEVVDNVCKCVGGTWKEEFELVSSTSKKHGDGLKGALERYGNATKRTEDYTEADLKFAKKTLNQAVFSNYHYLLP